MNELVLGEAVEQLIDHRGKTPAKLGSEFVPSGVPVASAILVKDGRLDLSEARCVDNATFRRWMPVPTQRGDVLLTSEAPLGRVARVPSDEPLVLGQRLFGLRGRRGVLDSGYLYYALQTARVQADLLGRSTGTTVFGIRQSALRQVRIPAPSFRDQRSIAEVLGALDHKIAANERAIFVADDLCAARVEFASNGAELLRLGELLRLNYGKALPATTRVEGPVAVYGSGGVVGTHDRALVDRPGIIVGRKGTVGAVYWADGPHYPIDTTYFVEAVSDVPDVVLYFLLRKMPLAELNSDSAVPGLNRDQAHAQTVRTPRNAVASRLGVELRVYLELMRALRAENVRLAQARDELLPVLMTGKLRVRDAEKLVEGVA